MSLIETINALCARKLGRLPDLVEPRGYNDKVQWLKLYDQRPEQVTACDKLAVRGMVTSSVGERFLIPASSVWPPKHFPCIAKATHDSGSATRVLSQREVPAATIKLQLRLRRKYGRDKGEWAYDRVPPAIIVEDIISDRPIDYKFHCVAGEVRWVQVIWDRHTGKPCEAILSPDGAVMPLHMDEKMVHSTAPAAYPGDRAWTALTDLARKLAQGWRYVRVDLYWELGQAWFGELTFWPRAGCYRSKDEPAFGEMLDIDLATKYPAIAR